MNWQLTQVPITQAVSGVACASIIIIAFIEICRILSWHMIHDRWQLRFSYAMNLLRTYVSINDAILYILFVLQNI
jgi:hypothetical protein